MSSQHKILLRHLFRNFNDIQLYLGYALMGPQRIFTILTCEKMSGFVHFFLQTAQIMSITVLERTYLHR